MRKKNICTMLTAALLLLLTFSCSSEQELDVPGNELSGKPGTVRFTLGGSAGDAVTRAAAGETHTAEEKKVVSLYAVIFKDAGTVGTVEDTDPFYKSVEIPLAGQELASTPYEFEVGEPGNFQICFVANPSEQLKGKFTQATSATVAAFKALVEEKAPDEKATGMLMTSDFKKATISYFGAHDLGVVELTRAMARIDIVNQTDGVTVTKVEFTNRAVKTMLVNDKGVYTEGYLETPTSKSYEPAAGLVGNSAVDATGNVYNGQIYSYEQYAKADVSGQKVPSLTITYHTGDALQTQTHTVKFEKKDPAQASVTPLPLKRNHLYTVKLSNSGAGIRFTLTVADWNQGEEFAVSSDEIAQGLNGQPDYSQAALGDIMLKDGSLVKPGALTSEQKPNAIGVVAYLFAEGRAGASLNTKLGRKPKGLVMALKNAGTNVKWDTSSSYNTTLGSQYQKATLKDAYAGSYDGYALTEAAKKLNNHNLAAFQAAIAYETAPETKAPQGTSGWYLPSMGEWIDILSDTGLGQVQKSDIDRVKNEQAAGLSLSGAQTTALNSLNAALNPVGGSFVDQFSTNNEYYWSSSEYLATAAYLVKFNASYLYFSNANKSITLRVRCVLAF